jgi:hypothetical protein
MSTKILYNTHERKKKTLLRPPINNLKLPKVFTLIILYYLLSFFIAAKYVTHLLHNPLIA